MVYLIRDTVKRYTNVDTPEVLGESERLAAEADEQSSGARTETASHASSEKCHSFMSTQPMTRPLSTRSPSLDPRNYGFWSSFISVVLDKEESPSDIDEDCFQLFNIDIAVGYEEEDSLTFTSWRGYANCTQGGHAAYSTLLPEDGTWLYPKLFSLLVASYQDVKADQKTMSTPEQKNVHKQAVDSLSQTADIFTKAVSQALTAQGISQDNNSPSSCYI